MSHEGENPQQGVERAEDLHRRREALFENEVLLIKILLVVSGASMFGGLSQTDVLLDLAGLFSFLVFLTAMGFSVVCTLCAAYWLHQCKKWDVKGHAAESEQEQARQFKRSNRYRIAMRIGTWASVILVVIGFVQLIVFLWIVAPEGQSTDDNEHVEALSTILHHSKNCGASCFHEAAVVGSSN